VAGGEIPKQIQAAVRPEALFPISGYAGTADWGGSAVVDFTYLDLVLTRGMAPGMAVEQTKKMVSFAREESGQGEAISGAGLMIVEPKAELEVERAAGAGGH
jgi:hypothetical protein